MCPETENWAVPPEFSTPSSLNQSAPFLIIDGTLAKLWVLLIVVGFPYRPKLAGKGGLNLGFPCLPSRDSKSAVSSPQI